MVRKGVGWGGEGLCQSEICQAFVEFLVSIVGLTFEAADARIVGDCISCCTQPPRRMSPAFFPHVCGRKLTRVSIYLPSTYLGLLAS